MRTRLHPCLLFGSIGLTGVLLGCSQGASDDDVGDRELVADEFALVASHGTDPGPRPGAPGAGSSFPGITAGEQTAFADGQEDFEEVDSVSGTIAGEDGAGLGPTFNGNACAQCHAQPSVGGTSPGLKSPQNPAPNPQVALAKLQGATNKVPPFVTADGPVREARFILARAKHKLDGGVHGIYTIKGRTDAPGCNLTQPDFATELANHNVIFRIPTPVFGLGLVEATTDATLESNLAANAQAKSALGIFGKLNTNGNDGTTTRFGWKAQNKSLVIFAGEAYNVEQGVSNEDFPQERAAVPGCAFNPQPEDPLSNNSGASDVVNFANFMRLSAPPTPAPLSAAASRGSTLFDNIGCGNCHTRNLSAGPSTQIAAFAGVTYHPFSDFAVHHMGATLADGIHQGDAGPDEFRTAPLWGLGQRLFFMHDGRTSDLGEAIESHSSSGRKCVTADQYEEFSVNGHSFQPSSHSHNCGSEANAVVDKYNRLSRTQQTDLLTFLRSL